MLDDFRIRKSGVAPATSMDLIYELINAGSGTTCGACEGYDEFVFFETGSDALDVHYLELVSPTMTYGPGDLAMGGNGTVGAGNSNTNINWILNGSLTGTQTVYTTKLNTECGCAAFTNIPATNIIPANSKVLAFTGSAPDAKFNTASLAGQTVYVIYSDDNSGCSGSGKFGNTCASNCTRFLTVFNHLNGDVSNKSFTTPASTSGGDMWDFASDKKISVGCTLTVLPIDLLYFNATYNSTSNIVNLNWATASETNNKTFTIQKSIDGIDWQSTYSTPAAGNSASNLYYSAVDENPTKGIAYYRLMQTDLDGLYKTSDPVAISVDMETKNVLIAPNPANTSISITFNTITDGVSILNVYDLAGRLLNTQQLNAVKGTNKTLLNVANYINGMYFINISNTLQQLSAKLVVNHN